MLKRGVCRWCKCTEPRACPGGCSWLDSSATLCSACGPVDQAWKDEPKRLPNMKLAFWRGFMAGTFDSRALEARNPYARSTSWGNAWRWWELGKKAAAGAIPMGQGSRGGLAPGQSVRGGGD